MLAPVYYTLENFFSSAIHLGTPVLTVFARTDRAFSEALRVYKRRLQGAKAQAKKKPAEAPVATNQAIEDRTAPLPFMNIWLTPAQEDKVLTWNPGRFVIRESINKTELTAQTMRVPLPVVSSVKVDLWTETDLEAQQIESQLLLRFIGGRAVLPIDWSDARWYKEPFNVMSHAKVLGQSGVILTAEPGWTDNSDLEEGDGRKLTRRTWLGKLQARIPYMPQEARLVRELDYALYDNTTDPPTLLVEGSGGAVED